VLLVTQNFTPPATSSCGGPVIPASENLHNKRHGEPDPTRLQGVGNGNRVESLQPSAVFTYTWVSRKRRG